MLAATPFPACSLFPTLSLSLSFGSSHLRFGSCQHLEKLKVAISAAHKFEASLVFKVSCSAEKGEKMHMQMQTSRYAVEQASIYSIPYQTLLLSVLQYIHSCTCGACGQKNRIEFPRCHLRLCFLFSLLPLLRYMANCCCFVVLAVAVATACCCHIVFGFGLGFTSFCLLFA